MKNQFLNILFFLTLSLILSTLTIGCTAAYFDYNREVLLSKPVSARAKIDIDLSSGNVTKRPSDIVKLPIIKSLVEEDIRDNILIQSNDRLLEKIHLKVTFHTLKRRVQPWGLFWLSYNLFGVPSARHIGTADIGLEMTKKDGSLIGSYRSKSIITKWSGLYYGRDNSSKVLQLAVREAMSNIKFDIEKDIKLIAAKLNQDTIAYSGPVVDSSSIGKDLYNDILSQFADNDGINVAVLDLEGENISKGDAAILSTRLRSELVKAKRFQIIEREEMQEILKEQGFQQLGCTNRKCAIEIGQLINVELIIAGTIGRIEDLFILSTRIIDVREGKIIKTANEEIEGNLKDVLKRGIPNIVKKLSY